MSRQDRRAADRLERKLNAYKIMCNADKRFGGRGFTIPGSQKRW